MFDGGPRVHTPWGERERGREGGRTEARASTRLLSGPVQGVPFNGASTHHLGLYGCQPATAQGDEKMADRLPPKAMRRWPIGNGPDTSSHRPSLPREHECQAAEHRPP